MLLSDITTLTDSIPTKSLFSEILKFKIELVPSISVERQGKRGHIETCTFMHMPPRDFVLESLATW